MIKKSIITLLLIFSILAVGCIDYKTTDNIKDADILKEIEDLENELNLENSPEEVVENVTLPDLEEEKLTNNEIQVVTINENELVKLKVTITDPDEDNVSYSFTPPLDNNGEWQTNYGDAGEYLIKLSATDGKLTTEKDIKIIVNRVNVAPTIDGVRDLRVKEGEVVNFEPVVDDPNKDPVSVTITEPLTSGSFTTDHTSSGEYEIIVTATDGELSTEKKFSLIIEDVNVLPDVTNLNDITVKEGEIVKIEPKVTDLDDDPITISISNPVGDDGIWETQFTDNGVYVVTITISDGKESVTQNVNVIVEDVNKAPEIVDVALVVQ